MSNTILTLGADSPGELNKAATHISRPQSPLTEREVEVLKLVARGHSNREIASRLIVSERTVRTHISNILGKLNLDNRTQAALYALRQGLATLDEA
jgi:NarL family two-component system response regulator LiaR